MPYIPQDQREKFVEGLTSLNKQISLTGELNYVITRLVLNYWLSRPRYQTIAEIRGVLADVSAEFYRRVAAPYENQKIRDNGDVYP